jgi:small conductance mechanosensitive channel
MPEDLLRTIVLPIALRILLAALVWLVGGWLARRSRRWLNESLQKTALTESFITLITTVSYFGILILTGLLALAALGVPVTVLATALGIVVVVLAIALQQSLANLAATVIILLFKPFELGDVIVAGGALGKVHEIQMLNTVLASADGKTHIVPNGKIQRGGLTNLSTTGMLRLDLSFRVGYGSDLEKAKEVLANLLAADDRVLSEPPARVFVQQLADSSVEVVAWPFVKAENYASLQGEIVERVKKEFDANGIVIPYPQQNVHLYTHKSANWEPT